MSDMFGGPPPAPTPPTPRRPRASKPKAPPAPAAAKPQDSRPATELQAMQVVEVMQADLPETPTCTGSQTPPIPRGPTRTLHDGRQVDSWSEDWRLECLARTLLQLGGAERDEWIRGYGTEAAQVALRLRIQVVRSVR